MNEKEFYKRLLSIDNNWNVSDIRLKESTLVVEVHLEYKSNSGLCPFLEENCPIYDYSAERRWRHLDTMQYQTQIVARLPRVKNREGKISTISIPWAGYSERYTYSFSNKVIELLKITKNQTQTAIFLQTSYDVVHGIMSKSVERGLALRSPTTIIESIGIDEKSFQSGQEYCTIITDATHRRVLEVEQHRTKEAAKKAIQKSLSPSQQVGLKTVTGDMWEAYQNTVKEMLPQASYVLDRFHLVKYLNIAIDKTRREEVKTNPVLKNARFALLKNENNLTEKQRILFKIIQQENYLVSQVWQAKENFKSLFGQSDRASAYALLLQWVNSLKDYTIKPLIQVRDMFERHIDNIANSLCFEDSNAFAERMNGSIQEIKTIARGFRNVENYRIAILFHLGKLSLNHS